MKLSQASPALDKSISNTEKHSHAPPSQVEQELRRAKTYIQQLQTKLKSILQENDILKAQLEAKDMPAVPMPLNTKSNSHNNNNMVNSLSMNPEKLRSTSVEAGLGLMMSKHQSSTSDAMNSSTFEEQRKKHKVPRLKLEVLPNYHGKSNKSINQSLLAAYQQKYAVKKQVK